MERRTRRVALVALVLVAMLTVAASLSAQIVIEREPWRPPALEPTTTCDVWSGTGRGNDPTLLVELRLCTEGERIVGQTQYSGKSSGWSLRSFVGVRLGGGDGYELRELAIVDQKPSPGWRFCTVDRYQLAGSAETQSLAGTYESAACHDHGELTLHLTATGKQPATGERRPTKAPKTVSDIPPDTPGTKAKASCGCRQAPSDDSGWAFVMVMALGVGLAAFVRGRVRVRVRARSGLLSPSHAPPPPLPRPDAHGLPRHRQRPHRIPTRVRRSPAARAESQRVRASRRIERPDDPHAAPSRLTAASCPLRAPRLFAAHAFHEDRRGARRRGRRACR